MTRLLSGSQISSRIGERFPQAISEFDEKAVVVRSEALLEVARFLKETPDLNLDYLTSITAVDFFEHFELVYHLTSIKHNHSIVLKTRCYGRESPAVPSVVSLWRGADLQERDIYDLMGIGFVGHPNLKRIFLWEGFRGHPLRKDFGSGA